MKFTFLFLSASVLIFLIPPLLPPSTIHTQKVFDASDIVINEFMASNDSTVADSAGEYDDWVELYNNGTEAIDIGGYYLSDKEDRRTKWQIPEGTVIEGNGYLIFWADEDGSQGDLHMNFKLSASGEAIIFSTPDSMVIDQVIFGQQVTDSSSARQPNGTGDFVIGPASFNGNNGGITANSPDLIQSLVSVYPNPVVSEINITWKDQRKGMYIEVYNLQGEQLIQQQEPSSQTQLMVDHLPAGIYVLKIDHQYAQKIILQ